MQENKKNRTKKPWVTAILPLLTGALASGLFLFLTQAGEEIKYDELALGQETAPWYSTYNGTAIHASVLDEVEPWIKPAGPARDKGIKHRVLWLGNSQLNGINQYEKGQENMVYHLFHRMRRRKVRVLGFSQPNAHLGEHYVIFEYIRSRVPFDTLVLPVVFDDTRNIKLREDIGTALRDGKTAAALSQSAAGKRILNRELRKKNNRRGDEFAALKNTLQEKSEAFLNGLSEKYVPLWSLREQARGSFFHFLYRFRNTVFNITAQTKRPVIKERYDFNMEAFKAILASAKGKNIGVLVYIAPLRQDVEPPYILAEYEAFKKDIREITEKMHAVYADLDASVPDRLWGSKGATGLMGRGELDFMHFKEPGHVLLAEKLERLLTDMFNRDGNEEEDE